MTSPPAGPSIEGGVVGVYSLGWGGGGPFMLGGKDYRCCPAVPELALEELLVVSVPACNTVRLFSFGQNHEF